MKFIRNWKISLPVAGVLLAGLAWLAFGYFGVQTAFIDDEVSEAAPVFDTPGTTPDEVAAQDPAPAEGAQAEQTGDDVAAPTDATSDVTADSAEPSVDEPAADEAAVGDTAAESAAEETQGAETDESDEQPVATDAAVEEPATTEAPTEPQIVTEASGSFSGTSRYDVSGEALVLGNGTEQRFLRFENFESSNGPDLNVYLFNPDDASDFIDLGDLKGNIGEQNYEIPADVDLSVYSEVSIWCVRFGTGFGTADLVAL